MVTNELRTIAFDGRLLFPSDEGWEDALFHRVFNGRRHGWAQRAWGWGAESVVAVDVVTADGELVRADEGQHSDLYWAARGAGAGFPGIIVNFHIATRPMVGYLGHTVHIYEMAEFDELMRWVYSIHTEIDESIELVVQSFVDEPEAGESEGVRRVLLSALSFATDQAHAELALAPFAQSPVLSKAVVVNHCAESSLDDHYAMQDVENPPGRQYISDNVWVDDCGDIDVAVSALRPVFGGPEADQSHRQRRFIEPSRWERLQRIITERDPEGRFTGYLCQDPATLNQP